MSKFQTLWVYIFEAVTVATVCDDEKMLEKFKRKS